MKRASLFFLSTVFFAGLLIAAPVSVQAQCPGEVVVYNEVDAVYDAVDATFDEVDATFDEINATFDEINATFTYGAWTPFFYDGYLVYFDARGLPFCYLNGVAVYVPQTWSDYSVATVRYRTMAPHYRAWHQRFHEPRYRGRVRHQQPRTVVRSPVRVQPPRVVVHSPARVQPPHVVVRSHARVQPPRAVVHSPSRVQRPRAVVHSPSRVPISRPRSPHGRR
ncbi:MAG: hypothetical protein CVU59_08195 [Deltaproteobacteria bacterium HGW-Deltaproteobacteria-17]|nr:MAG: hypothetical protein CVU59_08195 [Deltaproteobacteria bacterium HGW-Deltaproteobacteria-17]